MEREYGEEAVSDPETARAESMRAANEERHATTTVPDEDTFPQWLYARFADKIESVTPLKRVGWNDLVPEDKSYWEYEADAVRRAALRGGFKRPDTSVDPVAQLAEMERMEHENSAPTSQLSFDDDVPSLDNPIPNDDGSFTIYRSKRERETDA